MTSRRSAWLVPALVAASLALPLAAQAGQAGDQVVIAILDTGIDPDHPEFTACDQHPLIAWRGFTKSDDQSPSDHLDHGTGVASVAVGKTLGEAPCTPILLGKVCNASGCTAEDISQGIRWALAEGADIINISLGTARPTPELLFSIEPALAEARDADVLVTVAAGNGLEGYGLAPYPSSLGQPSGSHLAFIVGSADETGEPAVGHSSDPEATQAGVDVQVARAHSSSPYAYRSGTSFAAPNAAGIAAVTLAAYLETHGQRPSAERLEELLTWTARDDPAIPPALEGWGFLDASAAVEAVETGGAQVPPCQGLPAGTVAWASACLNEAYLGTADTVRRAW